MNEFKDVLKELREEYGLTQSQLAKSFYTSQQTISRWEKGERQPDFDMLINLARFFNVSIDDLLGFFS